jgi:type I restriction enzyme R subunit
VNTSTLVQKLWNYCNGPRLGRSLARSPAREHGGARAYTPELYRQKCAAVFEHVYESYPERAGARVEGAAG